MYAASAAFHQAVKNGMPQKAMLIFPDAVFTDEDIDVDTGIEFDDNFNMETDLAIGQMTSNEIRFALFNDERLLNYYEFGEFTATLGVLIATTTYAPYGSVMVETETASYIGSKAFPYMRRNRLEMEAQPSFGVTSLMAYDGKIYAFGSDGRYAVYDDETGANITSLNPVNAFMRSKGAKAEGTGTYYNPNTRILSVFAGGYKDVYEFVPLGVFEADRPNVPDQIRIDMTCYDRMTKFDKDMPTAAELGIASFPTTIGALFTALCNYVQVPYRTATFINSTAEITEWPKAFETTTMRTVMGWIAEAAASNARFDRDGYLIMDWVRTGTGQSYDEKDYSEFQPFWYETQQVNKLYNRKTQDGTDATVGSGDVGYLIQDNPLLAGAV